jgi:hypothetical protein
MAFPVKTGFPGNLQVADGYILRWRAVDPTTGNDVAGVVISNVAVQGYESGGVTIQDQGPYELIPGEQTP